MIIHPHVPAEFRAAVTKHATNLGLSKIPHNLLFTLIKINSKVDNYTYPRGECGYGYVYVLGNKDQVWLLLNGKDSWFKTSPILECRAMPAGFTIETENSFYELVR